MNDEFDPIFQALAHQDRRQILDIVKEQPGCSVNDVCGYFDSSRIAVMKHLRILEDAGLLVSEKEGRVRKLYFNVMPIQLIYERWTDVYSAHWAKRISDFKTEIEIKRKNHGRKRKSHL